MDWNWKAFGRKRPKHETFVKISDRFVWLCTSVSFTDFRCIQGVRPVAYPGIFFFAGRGGSTNSVEDRGQRERGSGGGSPLVRGSGGSCSLVQEILFHVVNFSQFLVL